MKIMINCHYCGKEWEENVYSQPEHMRCGTCGDTNLRVREHKKATIDYYEGAPAFEEKNGKHSELGLDMYDDAFLGGD